MSTESLAAVRRSKRAERLLVPAGFITTAGNAFQITAAAILVFTAEQTTLSVGWLFIAVSIPQVALAVMFGKLADRVDRRMLCVIADMVSAVSAFALPVWLWIGGPTDIGSYIANFLLAATTALFMPASNALVAASALAGFLVIWFGPTPLFLFNSLTFVASAVLTYAIGRKPARKPAAPVAETDTEAAAVPAPAPVHQPIKRLVLLYSNGNIGLMVANVILTALVLRTFNEGAWLIGVVDALAGAGFLIGAASYGWVSQRIKGLNLAVLGMLGNLVMFALQPMHYIVLMVCIPFAGFCFAQGRIAARTLLMRASPEEKTGRIFGSAQALGLALGIGATVVLSAIADATTVPYAFWGCAILQGAIAIGTYLSLVKPLSAPAKKPTEILEATAA
jgi:MFS family permease